MDKWRVVDQDSWVATFDLFRGANKSVFALVAGTNWSLNNCNLPPNISNMIRKITIHNHLDTDFWWCKHSPNDNFNLHSTWNNIRIHDHVHSENHHIWNRLNATKCRCAYTLLR